jgi:hypothetical protein
MGRTRRLRYFPCRTSTVAGSLMLCVRRHKRVKPGVKRFLLWTCIAVAAYFLLYFSSVDTVTYKSAGPVTPKPSYGWPSDGDFPHAIFAPAHLIDATLLRRSYWAPIPSRASPNPKSAYDAVARSWLETMAAGQTNVRFLSSCGSLPASLAERLGPISDSGGPFSKGCTGPAPKQRFLNATEVGGVYNVAIEQGGIGYFWFVERFVVDGAGKVVEEERIEPGGAANRQQVRSETNQSPAAAGPGR